MLFPPLRHQLPFSSIPLSFSFPVSYSHLLYFHLPNVKSDHLGKIKVIELGVMEGKAAEDGFNRVQKKPKLHVFRLPQIKKFFLSFTNTNPFGTRPH
jgi:hypothetical protein